MPKKKVSKSRSNKSKSGVAFIGNEKKSGHLLTSRPYGSASRFAVLIAYFFLFIFAVMSIYAIAIAPSNAGSWGTFVLFFGVLLILLTHENNVFPDIGKRLPHGVVAIILAFLSIPFFAATFNNFNFVTMIIGIVFLIPLLLVFYIMATPEEIWKKKKTEFKEKFKKKGKSGTDKVKKKVTGLRGKNRKRKIYRR